MEAAGAPGANADPPEALDATADPGAPDARVEPIGDPIAIVARAGNLEANAAFAEDSGALVLSGERELP